MAEDTATKRGGRRRCALGFLLTAAWAMTHGPEADAHDYVHSDFSASIQFYHHVNYENEQTVYLVQTSIDFQNAAPFSSAKVKGIFDVYYGDPLNVCQLSDGDYPDFTNVACIGSGQVNMNDRVRKVVLRTDLMLLVEAHKDQDALISSLTDRVQALDSDLASVKSSTAASVVALTKRIDALPIEFVADEAAYGLLKARLVEDLEKVFAPIVEQ